MAPVGAALVELEVEGAGNVKAQRRRTAPAPKAEAAKAAARRSAEAKAEAPQAPSRSRRLRRAREAGARRARAGLRHAHDRRQAAGLAGRARSARDELGIELQFVPGTRTGGPHQPRRPRRLRRVAAGAASCACARGYAPRDGVEEVKVIGLRRKIAEKMQESKRRIPHFAYVEEIDITELEALRAHLNETKTRTSPSSPCCRSSCARW